LAAAAAQRTRRLKLLIYGNLLPLHEPLRLAEELAMLDCMSNGRLISGFARGIPREYQVHNVPLSQSRARFEEAFDIIRRAWTEEVFSYRGEFWSYKDVAMWPRPVQQPHPPIWMPVVGSKESIEFAAKHDLPITPGLGRSRGLRDDIIRYYARCLAEAGHRITPDHLSLGISAYVADSKAEAVREMGPYHLYFNRTLFSHGNFTETELQRQTGYSSTVSTEYVSPENRRAAQFAREDFRGLTMADIERQAEQMPWGTESEVTERIIEAAESAGADNVQISLNRGVLPHEMFLEQIRRFGGRGRRLTGGFLQPERVLSLAHRGEAAIDRDRRSGDEIRSGGGEKDGDAGEVFGYAPTAGWGAGQHPFVQTRDLSASVAGQFGVDPAGQDGIDLDVVGRPGCRQRFGQLNERAFARGIGCGVG
jgi:alkanesulfonate monooxygenase SsuD/methylene tetrahydromethanopterin reductase-like flavin-dependent oxidoreductase (luciferase family)